MMFSSVVNKAKNFFKTGKIAKDTPEPFEDIKVYSPFKGIVVEQKNIPDEGFSEGYMGVGVGIKPIEDGDVIAPIGGNLEVLFKTQHAYVIREAKNNIAVMLHIGINTVNIPEEKGAFSSSLVQGQNVGEKEVLCQMNLTAIRENATSDISALLVQNENMEDKRVEFHKKDGDIVEKGELIMSVVK